MLPTLLPLLRVVFVRKTVVIFVVLFCPCNSRYLLRVVFVRATGICSSSARVVSLWQLQPFFSVPTFSHHILRNMCRLLFLFFLFFPFFLLSFFLFFLFFPFLFFYGLAGSLCSRTRYNSISLALPWWIATVWFTLFHSRLWPHNLYNISVFFWAHN